MKRTVLSGGSILANFPTLMQLCQIGHAHHLVGLGSHGGLVKINVCLFPYLRSCIQTGKVRQELAPEFEPVVLFVCPISQGCYKDKSNEYGAESTPLNQKLFLNYNTF